MDTFDSIMSDLKAGKYRPVYFLQGDEPFFIDKISSFIEDNLLTADQKVFNQTVVYGKDTDVSKIWSMAKRFPLNSDYQVVIVKEAQDLKKIEDLENYFQKIQPKTVLVLNYKYKTLDKRKKICSLIEKIGVLFTSSTLYENKVPDWINQYIKEKHLEIEPKASRMLVDYLGTDLSKISNAIDKLKILLPDGASITPDDIQKNVGISKDYNNFELQSAIIKGDALKAARIVNHFAANQKDNPAVLTVTNLFGFFCKMLIFWQNKNADQRAQAMAMGINPYFLKDYQSASTKFSLRKCITVILLLGEYDMKTKGVDNASVDSGSLIKELVFKIMHL